MCGGVATGLLSPRSRKKVFYCSGVWPFKSCCTLGSGGKKGAKTKKLASKAQSGKNTKTVGRFLLSLSDFFLQGVTDAFSNICKVTAEQHKGKYTNLVEAAHMYNSPQSVFLPTPFQFWRIRVQFPLGSCFPAAQVSGSEWVREIANFRAFAHYTFFVERSLLCAPIPLPKYLQWLIAECLQVGEWEVAAELCAALHGADSLRWLLVMRCCSECWNLGRLPKMLVPRLTWPSLGVTYPPPQLQVPGQSNTP